MDRTVPHSTPRTTLHRKLTHAALALAVSVVAACGSDSEGPTDIDLGGLTQAEATQMFSALVAAYGAAPTPIIPGGGGGALVPNVNVMVDTIQFTNQCQAGGTASVLSYDSIHIVDDTRTNPSPDTTYATNVNFTGVFDITTTFQSCGSTDSQGTAWTFDADPGLNLLFDFAGSYDIAQLTSGVVISSWNWNWDGTWSGNLNWSSNGNSGTCAVAMQWTATSTLNGSGVTSTTTNQSGTICGVNVSLTT